MKRPQFGSEMHVITLPSVPFDAVLVSLKVSLKRAKNL
jgi:hypothetical protein